MEYEVCPDVIVCDTWAQRHGYFEKLAVGSLEIAMPESPEALESPSTLADKATERAIGSLRSLMTIDTFILDRCEYMKGGCNGCPIRQISDRIMETRPPMGPGPDTASN